MVKEVVYNIVFVVMFLVCLVFRLKWWCIIRLMRVFIIVLVNFVEMIVKIVNVSYSYFMVEMCNY